MNQKHLTHENEHHAHHFSIEALVIPAISLFYRTIVPVTNFIITNLAKA